MITMISVGQGESRKSEMADLNNTWKEKARHGTEFYSGCKLHQFSLKELEALDTSFKFGIVSRMKEMKIRHTIFLNVLE